jgi:hypothetical protein
MREEAGLLSAHHEVPEVPWKHMLELKDFFQDSWSHSSMIFSKDDLGIVFSSSQTPIKLYSILLYQ